LILWNRSLSAVCGPVSRGPVLSRIAVSIPWMVIASTNLDLQ
jgi:hypothetical protein